MIDSCAVEILGTSFMLLVDLFVRSSIYNNFKNKTEHNWIVRVGRYGRVTDYLVRMYSAHEIPGDSHHFFSIL